MKKVIGCILSGITGGLIGAVITGKFLGKAMEEKIKKIDKFKNYYSMLNEWLILKQQGKSIDEYLKNKGYKTIAIYGMGEMGCRLLDELESSNVEVKYAVDENADDIYSEINIISPNDNFEIVDVIIVTATFAYSQIKEELQKKVDCEIISLEDIIYAE